MQSGITFRKAEKSQAKLRAALFGPAGSGKTFSALRIASGMVQKSGGTIALIDTERGSASLYADKFAFDVLELPKPTIAACTEAIQAAGKAGYEVLIIDSLSHAWAELLEDMETLKNAKYKGNYWAAWGEGTPKQRAFIKTLLDYPGHVIATMRVKTERAQEDVGGM